MRFEGDDTAEQDEIRAAQAARWRSDYDYDPAAEELAATARLSTRLLGQVRPEPEQEQPRDDFSIEPW